MLCYRLTARKLKNLKRKISMNRLLLYQAPIIRQKGACQAKNRYNFDKYEPILTNLVSNKREKHIASVELKIT